MLIWSAPRVHLYHAFFLACPAWSETRAILPTNGFQKELLVINAENSERERKERSTSRAFNESAIRAIGLQTTEWTTRQPFPSLRWNHNCLLGLHLPADGPSLLGWARRMGQHLASWQHEGGGKTCCLVLWEPSRPGKGGVKICDPCREQLRPVENSQTFTGCCERVRRVTPALGSQRWLWSRWHSRPKAVQHLGKHQVSRMRPRSRSISPMCRRRGPHHSHVQF